MRLETLLPDLGVMSLRVCLCKVGFDLRLFFADLDLSVFERGDSSLGSSDASVFTLTLGEGSSAGKVKGGVISISALRSCALGDV